MIYCLKQYDTELLKFYVVKKELGEIEYNINWINEASKQLLPIGLELNPKSLEKWLSTRVIPKNREFVEQVLAKCGLSHNDTIGIINLCKGLSLNDSYWVIEDGFEGKFADYNLYENKFTNTLALIAYTGYGSSKKKGFTSSPEFTTSGMLRKCWRRIKGKIYLYKGGTFGAANTGNEPYSEFYASQIAKAMELNHVEYKLSKWKNVLCSTCELFTDIDVSYVPIFKFVEDYSLTKVVDYLKALGNEYYDAFSDMIIFDAITFNTDRHFGNFGLLVDNKTNKPIKFAPIFDNGMSLFNFAMEDEIMNLQSYSKTRLPAFSGVSYDELIDKFLTHRQKDKLRCLINFKFKKHSRYNLPEKRLKQIEKFIQVRVRELLDKPCD